MDNVARRSDRVPLEDRWGEPVSGQRAGDPTRSCRRQLRLRVVSAILPLLLLALTPPARLVAASTASSSSAPALWGIDTTDNVQGDHDLSNTQTALGSLPQFVGRYLVWGSELTSSEALYLRTSSVPILLIDDPNRAFTNAAGDALQAIAQAHSLGVPAATAIFRDVEASDPITTSYITGYFKAFLGSGYVAGFYENPGSGDPFEPQYCAAVSADPAVASMPLYSSEPELQSFTPYASAAPPWAPGTPGCANTTVAWQYLEQGVNRASWPGNSPNVDVDEFDTAYQSLLWGFGDTVSSSEAVLNSSGQAQVVLDGDNGQAFTNQCCWQGWQGLPTGPALIPGATAIDSDGQMQVFAVGTNGQLYDVWQQSLGGSWSSWLALGQVEPGVVALGREADGSLDVFAVTTGGQLEHESQPSPGATWSGWTSLGGPVAGTPAVARDADGRLEVFVVGSNNGPLDDFFETGSGGWLEAVLGGTWSSAVTPSVVRNLDGRLEVFLTAPSGQLYHAFQLTAGGNWSGWGSLGGNWPGAIHDGVSAILNQYGEVQVFARGDEGNLYTSWQQGAGGDFGGWFTLGAPPGGITGGPFTVMWPDGHMEVFAFAPGPQGNALWHSYQACAEYCGWSGFSDLGGNWIPPTNDPSSSPQVGLDSAGDAEVALVGETGQVEIDQCCWQGWQGLPSNSTAFQPGAVVTGNGDGQMQVIAVGTNDQLYDIWQQSPGGSWSSWQSLGGTWPGRVALGHEADGDLDIFAVTTGGQLEHDSQSAPGGTWSGWTSLGGPTVAGTPVVGQDADGRLEVFVVGSDNGPLEDFFDSTGSGWQLASLGGSWSTEATPSVVRNLDGRLEVFLTAQSGQPYHAFQVTPGGGWSGWASLGGDWTTAAVHDGFSAIVNQYGEIQVFVRGTDGDLYTALQQGAGGDFGGWSTLGAPLGGITGGPLTVIWPDGHLEVFVFASPRGGNALWHAYQTCADGCGWSSFSDLGGNWTPPSYNPTSSPQLGLDVAGVGEVALVGANGQVETDQCCWQGWQGLPSNSTVLQPGAVVTNNGDGQMQVFAVGTDDQLYDIWQQSPGGTWSSWQSLGGTWSGQMAVGREADGNLDVFAVTTGGQLELDSQPASGGTWSGWSSLGSTTVAGPPAVGQDVDGSLEVFVVASNDGPLEDFFESGGSSWQSASLGGTWSSADTPSVVRNADGRLEVFLTALSGQLDHAFQVTPGGAWTGWASLGGNWPAAVHDGISAILNQYGEVEVFGRGDDGNLYTAWQQGAEGDFGGWWSLGAPAGGLTGGPLPMMWPDGHLEVFVFASSGNALWHTYQIGANVGGWSGFSDLSGSWTPPGY